MIWQLYTNRLDYKVSLKPTTRIVYDSPHQPESAITTQTPKSTAQMRGSSRSDSDSPLPNANEESLSFSQKSKSARGGHDSIHIITTNENVSAAT
jgi:hypothetical protein